MARHFSENEKQLIKKRLLVEGKELFENCGIRKTSVDKIVEKVGIAKGSFYNFYASKESMVFDLIMDMEIKMHKDEMDTLHEFLKNYEFPEALKYTVWKSLRYMDEEPLLLIHNDPQLLYEICSLLLINCLLKIRMGVFNDEGNKYEKSCAVFWRSRY